jgi:hypothetical protein
LQLLKAEPDLMMRTILITIYAAGLRISEVIRGFRGCSGCGEPALALECVLVRSDAVNLEIEPVEKPEAVFWGRPTHPLPE